jgi:hypothetical protein
MALHQGSKRSLVALLDETRQQFPIRRATRIASGRQLEDVLQDIPKALAHHVPLYL